MALEPHRFDHAQRGQRVDEAGCAFGRRRALGQHEATLRFGQAVLRVHGTAEYGHDATHQGLRTGRGTGRDDDARALVARGDRLTESAGDQSCQPVGDVGEDGRAVLAFGTSDGGDVRRPEQNTQVGRVDRRRFDPDDDLLGPGIGYRHRD